MGSQNKGQSSSSKSSTKVDKTGVNAAVSGGSGGKGQAKGHDKASQKDNPDRASHNDDQLTANVGNNKTDGHNGDDTLTYSMSDNLGGATVVSGGHGSDTLNLKLTAEQYEEWTDEIEALTDWIESGEKTDSVQGQAFETSFGVFVRNMESVNIEIVDGDGTAEPDATGATLSEVATSEAVSETAYAEHPSPSDFSGASVEKTQGTSGDDAVSGSDGSGVVRGGKGEDTIDGGAGDDVVDGRSGAPVERR